MSNIERDPAERRCGEDTLLRGIDVIEPREVPLGGPRAMAVRRTLPARGCTMIDPWCFMDHYGPDDVSETGGMNVPPHPHTGLQTVSWLFTGRIEHQDSAGHGPRFEAYTPEPVSGPEWDPRVFLGEFHGRHSPVHAFSPVVGGELVVDATAGAATLDFEPNPEFEHGVLLDEGKVQLHVDPRDGGEKTIPRTAQLAHIAAGSRGIRITVPPGEQVILLILGGAPFGEQVTMRWNFGGRSHDEIVAYRNAWQVAIAADAAPAGRFPTVVPGSHDDGALPAPALPNVRLKPRP